MSVNKFNCDCNSIHEDVIEIVKMKMLNDIIFDNATIYFKLIGDRTRIRILWALSIHEMCVCDIANILCMSKSAVSHQLSSLREANLVKYKKKGKSVYYSLADKHVKDMVDAGIMHVHQ